MSILKRKTEHLKQMDFTQFRSKNRPVLLISIIFFAFLFVQFFLLIIGGIHVGEHRITSVFAGDEVVSDNIIQNEAVYDKERIKKIDAGYTLKKHEELLENVIPPQENTETPNQTNTLQSPSPTPLIDEQQTHNNDQSVLGLETSNQQVLPSTAYSTNKPSITFTQPSEFLDIIRLEDSVELKNEQVEVDTNFENSFNCDGIEAKGLPSNGVSYQISPDGQNFYYFSTNCNWEKSDNSWIQSNSIEDINSFLDKIDFDVFDTKEIYFRAFLHSDGETQVTLQSLKLIKKVKEPKEREEVIDEADIQEIQSTRGTTVVREPELEAPKKIKRETKATNYNDPGEIYNDAYTYEDGFLSTDGLNLANSLGFTNTSGTLLGNTEITTYTSNCLQLIQPGTGTFEEWLFLDLKIDNTSTLDSSSLQIQDCSGGVLKTFTTLNEGVNSFDIRDVTNSSVRYVISLDHVDSTGGSSIDYIKLNGRSTGVTDVSISPHTTSINAGEEVNFTIQYSSNGSETRNARLIFSMDTINGLDTPTVDDGLAEDAEVDYGNGFGVNTYRPIEFVTAGNTTEGVVPVALPPGSTQGEVVWDLGVINPGVIGTIQISVKIPIGYINNNIFKAQALIRYGETEEVDLGTDNSLSIFKNSVNVLVSSTFNHTIGNIGSTQELTTQSTTVQNSIAINIENTSDGEVVVLSLDFTAGSCIPTYLGAFSLTHNKFPVQGNIISEPVVGSLATTPIIVEIDRIYVGRVKLSYNIKADHCTPGDEIQIVHQADVSSPIVTSQTYTLTQNIIGGVFTRDIWYPLIYRISNEGTIMNNYFRWPGWWESYIYKYPSFVTPGEYIRVREPYDSPIVRTHSIKLDRSYDLIYISDSMSFHGIVEQSYLSSAYKDCSGSGLIPNDPLFDHNDPQNSGWHLVDTNWNNSPFSNPPNNNDPRAVVPAGCRLLYVKEDDNTIDTAPDYGEFSADNIYQICDGTYCPEPPEGSISASDQRIYSYETVTDPTGQTHSGMLMPGYRLYKGVSSLPSAELSELPVTVDSGAVLNIKLHPTNHYQANLRPDNRWGVNLFRVKNHIDLFNITSQVDTAGSNIPPGGNVNNIVFHPPDPGVCMASTNETSTDCLAWWEVPNDTQPPSAWGQQGSTSKQDEYIPIYKLQLNVSILPSAPAGTPLEFIAESRAYNTNTGLPTTLGANNVNPITSGEYSRTYSTLVTEIPSTSPNLTAPRNRDINQDMTYNISVINTGNGTNNGIYLVNQLPKAGVIGTEYTPNYRKAYVSLNSQTSSPTVSDIILETSSDSNCFANPLTTSWNTVTLQATTRPNFIGESTTDIPASTYCLRARRDTNSTIDIQTNDSINLAFDININNDSNLYGDKMYSRGITGASQSFGSSPNGEVSPLETISILTTILNEISLDIDQDFIIDETREGFIRWDIWYHNASGSVANNVALNIDIPNETEWHDLIDPLNSGVTCTGGSATSCPLNSSSININIATLDIDDGNIDSGDDEGVITFWTKEKSGTPPRTSFDQFVEIIPEYGTGDDDTDTVTTSDLELLLTQSVSPNRDGSNPPKVGTDDEITYTLSITNKESFSRFYNIYNEFPTELTFVPGSIKINGTNYPDSIINANVVNYQPLIELNPDESISLEIKFTVNSGVPVGTSIVNKATVTSCYEHGDFNKCSPAKDSNEVESVRGNLYYVKGRPTDQDVLKIDNLNSLKYPDGTPDYGYDMDMRLIQGDNYIAEVTANLIYDLEWGAVNADVTDYKSVAYNLTSAPEASSTFTLFVPKKVNSKYVVMCPDATNINEVSYDCSNNVTLDETSSDVEIVDINGKNYWKVSNVVDGGGISDVNNYPAEIEFISNDGQYTDQLSFGVDAKNNPVNEVFYAIQIDNNLDFNNPEYINPLTFDTTEAADESDYFVLCSIDSSSNLGWDCGDIVDRYLLNLEEGTEYCIRVITKELNGTTYEPSDGKCATTFIPPTPTPTAVPTDIPTPTDVTTSPVVEVSPTPVKEEKTYRIEPIYPIDGIKVDSREVELNWIDNGDYKDIKYDIYVDGSLVGSSNDSKFFITLDEGEHTWYVIAFSNEEEIGRSSEENFFIDLGGDTVNREGQVDDVGGIETAKTENDDDNLVERVVNKVGVPGLVALAFLAPLVLWMIPLLFLLLLGVLRNREQVLVIEEIDSKGRLFYGRAKVYKDGKLIQEKISDIRGKVYLDLKEGIYDVLLSKSNFVERKIVLEINNENQQEQEQNEDRFKVDNKFEIHVGLKKDIKNTFSYKYQMERFKLNIFTLTLIPAFLCALVNVFMTGGVVPFVILGGIIVVTLGVTVLLRQGFVGYR